MPFIFDYILFKFTKGEISAVGEPCSVAAPCWLLCRGVLRGSRGRCCSRVAPLRRRHSQHSGRRERLEVREEEEENLPKMVS